jgi:hypothetical protein
MDFPSNVHNEGIMNQDWFIQVDWRPTVLQDANGDDNDEIWWRLKCISDPVSNVET